MFAQYSPLFQSGLLSDSPTSSRSSTPALHHKRPTPSLPLTVNTTQLSAYADDLDSPLEGTYFFTLAQQDEDQSFLSLDLADSVASTS